MIKADQTVCPSCGAAITDDRCPYCGIPIYDLSVIDMQNPCYIKFKRGGDILKCKVYVRSCQMKIEPEYCALYADGIEQLRVRSRVNREITITFVGMDGDLE